MLISVAGFSPETTIVTTGVFRPEQVLVISSGPAYEMIDVIGDFVRTLGLRASQFHHEPCNPTDLSLFEIICRRVKAHRQARGSRPNEDREAETLIDITGGKKVMSAGAALAAGELDLRICYIDNEYDQQRRTAIPGTEAIVLLESPYLLYGGTEIRRANHDFDMGAFEAAGARYAALAERLNEPATARFLRELSIFYNAWRNLDIEGIKRALPAIEVRLADSTPTARANRARLETQLAFVQRLVAGERSARIMTLFLLGEANLEADRYDFSALLFYRTIEASIASRLEHQFPGFLCEKPDYTKINPDVEELAKQFAVATREVFGKPDASEDPESTEAEKHPELPRKVGCLDGALLLRVTKDDLLDQAKLGDPKALSRLGNLTTTRNRSILAHGYESVTEKSCNALRAPARQLLSAYWTLNNEPVPFADAIEELRFLRLEP